MRLARRVEQMHRFFISPQQIVEGQVSLGGDQARQIAQVLRMRPGEEVVVLDNAGWAYRLRLTAVTPQQVRGQILERQAAGGEPAVQLTLYMGLMKRDKFEWVLQKGTEVGVSAFVPVVTQRSLVQDTEMKPNKRQRWQKIVTEAAEQAGRGRLPRLHDPARLAPALQAVTAEVALMPWEGETAVTLRQALPAPKPHSVALFIGPEGGFDAAEVEMARGCGLQPVTLGERILRAETAAIVASALVLYELG